jgi:sugar phosphate isomerase/epimerase
MSTPIAVQLYSLREEMEEEFELIVDRIAAIGYVGVETAGFPQSITPKIASRIFKELGLIVAGAHLPLPLGDVKNQVIEAAIALDSKWIVSGAIDREYFQSYERVLQACDLFNEAGRIAGEHGLRLAIHNHWWEYEKVDGHYPYKVMLDKLEPSISFELDSYWIQVAGHDPRDIVAEIGARAPFLHIKDGPATDSSADMVAVGDGVVDYHGVIQASGGYAKWLIVELDRCATDMGKAVERSFTYLTSEGLAHGKQS